MDAGLVKTAGLIALLVGIFVVLPVVALLMEHQRKMVLLMRGEKSDDKDVMQMLLGSKSGDSQQLQALEARVAILEAELGSLKGSDVGELRERL